MTNDATAYTSNHIHEMPPQKRSINLLRGWPSPSLLPAPLLSRASQRTIADPSIYTSVLQYGPDPGYQPLREGLAQWLGRHYHVEPDADRICITGGASQNIACVLQSFTDPVYTRAVWMLAPCYHLVCPIFEDSGFKGRLRATPEDEEGVDLGALERKILALEKEEHGLQEEPFKGDRPFRKLYRHVIYVVATCANPSGKTMSLRRREGLVRLARKYNALVISDDVYDFLQWPISGSPSPEYPPEMRLPRLCDIDRAIGGEEDKDPEGFGYAISNGSFSKLAGPGVRTGWVEASKAFVKGLSQTGSTKSGGAPSQLCAAMLSDLVHSGELKNQIEETVRPALQRRHKLMMDAIRQYISPLGVRVRPSSLLNSDIYGGYFVWFTLDRGLPTKVIAEAALTEENLIIGVGNMFEVHGDDSLKFDSEIRLCFAWEPEEDLVEGVKRLGNLLHRTKLNKEYYEKLARSGGNDQQYIDSNK